MDDYYSYSDDLQGLEVTETEYVAVTPDDGSHSIADLLQRIKRALGMDVVYVSQFVNGMRVVREVAADDDNDAAFSPGLCDPFEESYCYLVAESRLAPVVPDTSKLPLTLGLAATKKWKIGSHVAAPIVGADGKVHGTVCCFTHQPLPRLEGSKELAALRSVASLLATTMTLGHRG